MSLLPTADQERPLSLKVQLAENDPLLKAILSVCVPLKPRAALMVAAIVANFRMAPSDIYFYSRDKNHYAAVTRRYFPEYYTYETMKKAVDVLARAGLVEDLRTRPSPSAKKRSRLRATAHLLGLFQKVEAHAIQNVSSELIVLKTAGKNKRLLTYDETLETTAMRAQVHAFNTFQSQFDVGLNGEPHAMLSISARQYHRVFNGDFKGGGRWYALWQNLKKELRPSITINGSPTSEFDISCCHPRLLCAITGLQLPFDDPSFDFYDLPGFDRALVKVAVNILFNANRSPVTALTRELRKQGIVGGRALASELFRAIKAKWPVLAPYWGSGVGLKLQNVDASICSAVHSEMQRRGIPVLSIHDSFIVPSAFEKTLWDVVGTAIDEVCCHNIGHLEKAETFAKACPIASNPESNHSNKTSDPWRKREGGKW